MAFFRQCGAVFYVVLYGAVRCIHVVTPVLSIDFMISEGGDPLSLPFTSKTGQSHSVAQNRHASYSFTLLALKERTFFGIL